MKQDLLCGKEKKKWSEMTNVEVGNEAIDKTINLTTVWYAEVSFCGADATLLALFYFRAKTVSVMK